MAFAAAPALASGQISLSTAVELALRNSSAVKLAQADVSKAQASLAEVKDAYIPNLTLGSTVGASVGFPTGQPSIANASMQSLVWNSQQREYIRSAHAGLEASSAALKDAREQAALDTASAYIELDTVSQESAIAHDQSAFTARLVAIETQRTDAGVDPLSDLLQARLTAAQLNLKLLHLQSRAKTLVAQLVSLTGLPAASIIPDHASIPEIPAVTADTTPVLPAAVSSAQILATSKQFQAKGDQLAASWRPQVSFGAQYNLDSDKLNNYATYYRNFTPNNVSFGFSILVPIFDFTVRAKARQTAADALRATVEAEQARRQNDVQIASLAGSIRELDTLAEIATLKQQISTEQLKAIESQLQYGNGSGVEPGAAPQLSPKAEQLSRIDEGQKSIDAIDAGFDLAKARLNLLRALGHMDDWLHLLPAPTQTQVQTQVQTPGNHP